jgi:uncharacterized 2Fe-2S/4Fe-4S cluster protein (DUF4445 family)
LDAVHVAGAFGASLRAAGLCALGVLPSGSEAVTRGVGNAALYGALELALEPGLIPVVMEMAQSAQHVELALRPGFTEEIMKATTFEAFNA